MKHIQTFKGFINEGSNSINEAKNIGDELTAKFTKETGIKTWDKVKLAGESGKWTVTRLWAPKDDGGMNPGLHIELTQGTAITHFMVMDDNGELANDVKRLKKI